MADTIEKSDISVEDIANWLTKRRRAEDVPVIAAAFLLAKEDVQARLDEGVRRGALTRTKRGKYATPEQTGLLLCRAVAGGGMLFARPMDDAVRKSLPGDIRLAADEETAWPDDLVLVRLTDAGEKPRGTLVSVASRAHETLTASVVIPVDRDEEKRGKRRAKGARRKPRLQPANTAIPEDSRITDRVTLLGDLNGAKNGDIVLIRMLTYPHGRSFATGTVESVIGDSRDLRVKLRAIAVSHGLPLAFDEAALAEASKMPESVLPEDIQGRADYRGITTFTIDGADAKDFDDAVSLEPLENGGWRLGVHIADVSHYVKPSSPIDIDALERTTSTYLPGLTFPMLPEALSNRLCSLMPQEERLTLSCVMEIRGGKIGSYEISPSVIRSSARLVYGDVNRFFRGEESKVPESLRETLLRMLDLSRSLRAAREKRGAIEFDLPEPEFDLDGRGEPTDVRARERGEAEKLIEDFMLAANETVAKFARESELPIPYRVHEPPDPDRLSELGAFLESLEIPSKLTGGVAPSVIQSLLNGARGTPEEYAVNSATLRAMRRAEYGAMPHGHFALAARDYCHFTSPIRRYPDLTVHRVIKEHLAGRLGNAELSRLTSVMPETARRCSEGEYAAAMAEREADDMLRARYMANRVGEEFDGIVSGISRASAFVSLKNTAEGRVPAWTLDEPYAYDEDMRALIGLRSRDILRVGDRVRVCVETADPQSGYIEFRIVERL